MRFTTKSPELTKSSQGAIFLFLLDSLSQAVVAEVFNLFHVTRSKIVLVYKDMYIMIMFLQKIYKGQILCYIGHI